jgi:heme/copper-type cytochrome/quinol oxidase subunit 1
MTARKQDPEFTPRQITFTGGNVMVSSSILVLAISLAVSVVTFKNSFEKRMDQIEWRLEAMSKDRWTLPRAREAHNQLWRDNPTLKMEGSAPDVIAIRIPN